MTGAALVGLVLAVYVALCIFFPLARCGRCSGNGKIRQPLGRAYRRCGGCGGSGERVRLGRRLMSWFFPYDG